MKTWLIRGLVVLLAGGLIWGGLAFRNRTFAWEDCEAPRAEYTSSLEVVSDWDGDLTVAPLGDVEFPVSMIPIDAGTALVTTITGSLLTLDLASGESEQLLDFSDEIIVGDEQGLLGLALPPDRDFLYLTFTDVDGTLILVEFTYPELSDRRLVMTVPQPQRWHNGGNLLFGPDEYLYVALGDGGGKADQYGNGQNLDTTKGSVIRIDPRPDGGRAYGIPADNPFVDGDAPEVFVYGLRNPWRIWFDDGDLWIADVGQNCVEEINVVPAGESGLNFGWPGLEGDMRVRGPIPDDAVEPFLSYNHDPYGCSIIGGGIYEGSDLPDLVGMYLFADYCNGRLRAMDTETREVFDLGVKESLTVSFGFDADGEPYLLTKEKGILKLLSE